jgi:hypothetical protein
MAGTNQVAAGSSGRGDRIEGRKEQRMHAWPPFRSSFPFHCCCLDRPSSLLFVSSRTTRAWTSDTSRCCCVPPFSVAAASFVFHVSIDHSVIHMVRAKQNKALACACRVVSIPSLLFHTEKKTSLAFFRNIRQRVSSHLRVDGSRISTQQLSTQNYGPMIVFVPFSSPKATSILPETHGIFLSFSIFLGIEIEKVTRHPQT